MSPTGLAASPDGGTLYVSQDANAAVAGGGQGALRQILLADG